MWWKDPVSFFYMRLSSCPTLFAEGTIIIFTTGEWVPGTPYVVVLEVDLLVQLLNWLLWCVLWWWLLLIWKSDSCIPHHKKLLNNNKITHLILTWKKDLPWSLHVRFIQHMPSFNNCFPKQIPCFQLIFSEPYSLSKKTKKDFKSMCQ